MLSPTGALGVLSSEAALHLEGSPAGRSKVVSVSILSRSGTPAVAFPSLLFPRPGAPTLALGYPAQRRHGFFGRHGTTGRVHGLPLLHGLHQLLHHGGGIPDIALLCSPRLASSVPPSVGDVLEPFDLRPQPPSCPASPAMHRVVKIRSPWRSWPNRKGRKQDRTKPCGWLRQSLISSAIAWQAAHQLGRRLFCQVFIAFLQNFPKAGCRSSLGFNSANRSFKASIQPAATRVVRRVDDGLPPSPPPDAWDLGVRGFGQGLGEFSGQCSILTGSGEQWLPPPLLPLPDRCDSGLVFRGIGFRRNPSGELHHSPSEQRHGQTHPTGRRPDWAQSPQSSRGTVRPTTPPRRPRRWSMRDVSASSGLDRAHPP